MNHGVELQHLRGADSYSSVDLPIDYSPEQETICRDVQGTGEKYRDRPTYDDVDLLIFVI